METNICDLPDLQDTQGGRGAAKRGRSRTRQDDGLGTVSSGNEPREEGQNTSDLIEDDESDWEV